MIPFELLDNLEIGIFRFSAKPPYHFIFANKKLCEVLKINCRKILEINAGDIFCDVMEFQGFMKDLDTQKSILRQEVGLRTAKRKVLGCSISLVKGKGKAGATDHIDGFIGDISEQKRIEQELSESRELFKTVFNNSAATIMVTDKNERIVAWNPFAEKMLGMNRNDLFNKPVKELYPTREWRRMRSFKIRKKGMLSDIETQVYHKNGEILYINISISMIHDADGNVVGSIGIMHDISKQKVAEKRIRDSESKIRAILENSAAGILLTDEENRLVLWNRYLENLLGCKKKDLYLKPLSNLYPDSEWKKIKKEFYQKKSKRHHFETKVLCNKNEKLDVFLSINVLADASENFIGSVGVIQDMSEQKQFQEMLVKAKKSAEEASHSKSLFLANMSHEVRTPMNTIIGMLDLTLDTSLSVEQRENLMTVKAAADSLLSILNDILDLSRVEAGKVVLENINLDVASIVQSVCKGMYILAKNKKVELLWEISDKVPAVIKGDPLRIRQILVNLINNAIKFTTDGKVTVRVDLESIKGETCELRFSVADEGIGIPKEKLEDIFKAFTQADVSTTRKFGGTGLGLAISKKLVEMMAGRIWAESVLEKGSTFHFTGNFKIVSLEREVAEKTGASIEDQLLANLPRVKMKTLQILLAEDNLVNQKIAQRMLEKKGWTVKCANNGKEVVEMWEQEKFDLILMDAQMPVMDGFEATGKIRDKEKETGQHIPIVALTARAMSGDKDKCLSSGMDYYVSKPIDREIFYETIENVFLKRKVQ